MKATLDEMQVLIAVVDSGAVSRAAEQLGQTVSATSRSLARLEEKLQATLLHRTTRRLALTEEGDEFLRHARRIVAAAEMAEEALATRLETPSGLLRVDAPSPFMLHVIAPLVASYRTRYPRVTLELLSQDQISDLLERRTDVAFRFGRLGDSTLHARRLGSSRIRLLASPDYLATHGQPQSVEDLMQHALLGFGEPESLNHWPLPGHDGGHLHITPVLRASSGEMLRQLALDGAGIVCLSDFMTARDRAEGRLLPVLAAHTLEVGRAVHAVYYRNTTLSSRIQSFVDHVAAAMSEAGFE